MNKYRVGDVTYPAESYNSWMRKYFQQMGGLRIVEIVPNKQYCPSGEINNSGETMYIGVSRGGTRYYFLESQLDD